MPFYAVFSKVTEKGAKTIMENPERIKEVNSEIESMGVKVVAQYAVFGEYDFLTILEAPDDETVIRVLVNLSSRGTIKTITYKLIPIDQFISMIKQG